MASTQKDYKAKHARRYRALLEQIDTLETKLKYFDQMVQYCLQSNWPQAARVAQTAESLLGENRKRIIYTAEYKEKVLQEYKDAPMGRKGRVLDQYRVTMQTFRNWQKAQKNGTLKSTKMWTKRGKVQLPPTSLPPMPDPAAPSEMPEPISEEQKEEIRRLHSGVGLPNWEIV